MEYLEIAYCKTVLYLFYLKKKLHLPQIWEKKERSHSITHGMPSECWQRVIMCGKKTLNFIDEI